jgi:hypothetical protein
MHIWIIKEKWKKKRKKKPAWTECLTESEKACTTAGLTSTLLISHAVYEVKIYLYAINTGRSGPFVHNIPFAPFCLPSF